LRPQIEVSKGAILLGDSGCGGERCRYCLVQFISACGIRAFLCLVQRQDQTMGCDERNNAVGISECCLTEVEAPAKTKNTVRQISVESPASG